MTTAFLKMNGLGNDFVVIDIRREGAGPGPAQIRRIADRRLGVGCDQLILMQSAEPPADLFMRIFNPDGSEAEACGNATRCVARLVGEETGKREVAVRTVAGLLHTWLLDDGRVTVDMGEPRFGWAEIPLAEEMSTLNLDIPVGPLDAPELSNPCAVNLGNPHCIFFVRDITGHRLEELGPLLEHHPLFPQRTNVELAQVTAPDRIRLRVWERGTGITPACGSGACATAVAAVRRGLTERHMAVEVDGGELLIEWTPRNHVLMTGAIALAFRGEMDASLLAVAE